jgi:hypothetical protein
MNCEMNFGFGLIRHYYLLLSVYFSVNFVEQ